MYVGKVAEKIESSGLGEGNAFTIAASAKAFEVLSSNLYQNKILAVIREISCNAADAHRMVGIPLSQIKVHLPNFTEPYFSVRDYGPGLSHADVLSLYTTYFRSTKDNDNSQIGGFGLGSKSPFAVADQFTVTSWHGGHKRSYICYKDGGLPRVNLVGDEACLLVNTGIEVQVAAKEWYPWEREATNFFKWWPDLPRFNGNNTFRIEPVTFAMDGSLVSPNKVDGLPEWAFLPSGYSSQVFMGLVAYSLNWSAIPNVPQEVADFLSSTAVFLRLPIGAVSISPSREALSYDPSTCATLLQKLREIVREAVKVFKVTLDQQITLYEARQFIYSKDNKSLSRIMMSMATGGGLTWQGQRIHQQVHVDASDFGDGVAFDMVVKKYHHKNPQRYLQNGIHYDHGAGSNDFVVWSATAPRNYGPVLMHNKQGEREWRVIIIKGSTLDDVTSVCLAKGLPVPIDYSTLEVPPAAAKAPRGSAPTKTTGYLIDIHSLSCDRTTAPIDLKGGGIYLDFVNGEPGFNHIRALHSLRTMDFLPQVGAARLIGLSKAMREKSKSLQAALDTHGWVRFDHDWVHANVPESFLEGHYKTGAILSWLSQGSSPRRSVLEKYDWPGAETVLKMTRPFLGLKYDYQKYGEHAALDYLLSENQIKAKRRGLNAGHELAGEWKKFLDMHPMLNYVNFQNVPEAILNTYINR
jgi:hypothetical protein